MLKRYCVEEVEKFSKDGEDFTTRNYYGENEEQIFSVTGYGEANCDVENEIMRQDITAEKGFIDQETATKFANKLTAKMELKTPGAKVVSIKVLD